MQGRRTWGALDYKLHLRHLSPQFLVHLQAQCQQDNFFNTDIDDPLWGLRVRSIAFEGDL
jgi:hypothetical protein